MVEDPPAAKRQAEPESESGRWLVRNRSTMDRGEARWLDRLATFDRERAWLDDGQLSCVDWLMWQTKMARATAFEKLRIAHELRRRPLLRDAFAAGRLSYSAVRAITRLDRPDPGVDEALIQLAETGTVADLERMARIYDRYASQDRPPVEPRYARGCRIRARGDGFSSVELVLEHVEAAELAAAINAFLDRSPVDQSPAGDTAAPEEAPMESSPWPSRRADAFMDLIRTGVDHAGEGYGGCADRYLVHLVERDGETELIDGTPIEPAVATRVACDRSTVTHIVDGDGGPLALGRRTRTWNTAQRRAIAVRDAGTCRFPGCTRRLCDIHHVVHWEDGGPTDVDNGMEACDRHHTLLHQGYRAVGDANRQLHFYRPNGTWLGSTAPRRMTATAGTHFRDLSGEPERSNTDTKVDAIRLRGARRVVDRVDGPS